MPFRQWSLFLIGFILLAPSGARAEGTQPWTDSEEASFLPIEQRDPRTGELTSSDPPGRLYGRDNLADCRLSPLYFRLKTLLDEKDPESLYKMKALDLLSFFPKRTVAGETWKQIEGKPRLGQLYDALYEQLEKKATLYPPKSLNGHKQEAVMSWLESGQEVIKIPFPVEQEEAVRKSLVTKAKAELARVESLLQRQHEAMASESGRNSLVGQAAVAPESKPLKINPNDAGDMRSLKEAVRLPTFQPPPLSGPGFPKLDDYMPRPTVRKMPDSVIRETGGNGPARVVLDPKAVQMTAYNPIGCYQLGFHWLQRGRMIGHPLSDEEQKTLFTPPTTKEELAARYALVQRLAQANYDYKKWLADQPSIGPAPPHSDDSHGNGFDRSNLPTPWWQSWGVARGMRRPYELESEAKEAAYMEWVESEALGD